MIIKNFSDSVNDPKSIVQNRIIASSHLVNFGLGHVFKLEDPLFTKPWLTEYQKGVDEFKLFKTRVGSDKTSDFFIKGQLIGKREITDVRFSASINPSLILGFLGLILFLYAIFYLLAAREYLSTTSYWLPVSLLLVVIYTLVKRREYKKSLEEFRKLIHGKLDDIQERNLPFPK